MTVTTEVWISIVTELMAISGGLRAERDTLHVALKALIEAVEEERANGIAASESLDLTEQLLVTLAKAKEADCIAQKKHAWPQREKTS